MSPASPGMLPGCPFCAIAAGLAPATVLGEWPDETGRPAVIAISPRHPVVPGHVLVIPCVHVADAGTDPAISAATMRAAAGLAAGLDSANIITSKGSPATQTVPHLHLHVVPRRAGDGLHLPWAPRPAGGGEDR